MKVKVIKAFIDKYNKKYHAVGETLEITAERFAEISKVGALVQEVQEASGTETVEPTAQAETKITKTKKKAKGNDHE